MGELSKYRVILSGKLIAEYDRRQVLEKLADVFNSRVDMMEKLLQGTEVPLKKQYDKDRANRICQKIRKAGAQCKIEMIPEKELTLVDDSQIDQEINYENGVRMSGVNTPKNGSDSVAAPEVDLGESSEHRSDKEKLRSLLMRFVGTNADYYRHQFNKFGSTINPKFRVTWHWPAFFFFFFWALYRKMWFWAGVHIIAGVILMMWANPGLIYLLWALIWSLVANYLYFRTAAGAANIVLANPEFEQNILNKGGASRGGVWGGILVVVVSVMFLSNYAMTKFMEKYGDQIKDVLPGSGSQTRGDGSILGQIVNTSKLGKSSLILSGLATSLKILLVTESDDNNKQTIAKFIEKINNGNIADAWGSGIRVEQKVDRYVLVSMGPDHTYQTDDDILQPIFIP